MLELKLKGKVTKGPEAKISQRGVAYTKFTVEIPIKQGMWPARVYLTAFGDLAKDAERLYVGTEIEAVAAPSARAYTDKMGKPAGLLEGILRSYKVVSSTKPVAAPVMQATLTDDDIPF